MASKRPIQTRATQEIRPEAFGLAGAGESEMRLFGLFLDSMQNDGLAFLKHVGVDVDALPCGTDEQWIVGAWVLFKAAHMIKGVVSDELAAQNLLTFPPMAAAIAEAKRQHSGKASRRR